MQRFDDHWVVSAGDLVDDLECGHRVGLAHALATGLLSVGDESVGGADVGSPGRLVATTPVAQVVPEGATGGLSGRLRVSAPDLTAVRHGEAHERRVLAHLRRCFGTDGVVEIPRPAPTPDALAEASERTRRALAAGAPVVYQGVLFDGSFQGRPDFLVAAHRDPRTGAHSGPAQPGHYEPYDAKLARQARPGAVLQLAAYAVAMPSVGVAVPRMMHLLHPARESGMAGAGAPTEPGCAGGGRGGRDDRAGAVGMVRSFRVDDVVPMVRHARSRLDARLAAPAVVSDPSWAQPRPECASCAFSEHCTEGRAAARDLSLVAGLRTEQRRVLRGAGITSVEELAAARDEQRPAAMSAAAFAGLRLQAELQAAQDATRSADDPLGTVTVRMVDVAGLASLPVADPADIYFDMEGDPYALDAAGLEYLFGAVTLTEPPSGCSPVAAEAEAFRAFWAHDRHGERLAFESFVDWAAARLREHPGAHIYHYAPYELNALRRLAARHGTRERQVDELLAGNRLIDLYAVVRRSLRISQPSYSIKYLEPLFFPDARQAAVKNAADSIVAYESFLAYRAAGETAEADRVLAEIAEYNQVDCVSTHRLHRWLLRLRQQEGVAARGSVAVDPGALGADVPGAVEPASLAGDDDPDALVDALVAGLPPEPSAWSADQRARALLAAAVGYHRRENKPAWWTYFAALIADRVSLEAADDCAVPTGWAVIEDWEEPSGRRRRSRRLLQARVDPNRPHPFDRGESVRLLYPGPPGAAGGTTDAVVERAEPHVLLLRESVAPDAVSRALPTAVLPGAPVRPEPKPTAVRELARRAVAALPGRLPEESATDLLRREPPRLIGPTAGLPVPEDGDDQVTAVLAAVSALDGSYLAVQGPPGAGKTYLAGRLIQHLIAQGKSVGICSTSHKAIENAMLAATGQPPPPTAHAESDDVNGAEGAGGLEGADGALPWRPLVAAAKKQRSGAPVEPAHRPPWDTPRDLRALAAWREAHPDGHLVGDTAWAFANPTLAAVPFDVLIIDEAGQFALADTLAVAPAARNLVLLGDPQQLPQVVAGIHPEGADASALSHLLGDAEVIPPALGYFLDRTRRLHPAVCAPVSALAYRGLLRSHPIAATRAVTGVPAGLYLHDVVHTDNGTRSDEEVSAVGAIVRHLMDRLIIDGEGSRPLAGADVLVVAPYNRQVRAIERALEAAGLPGVRVGTVDRFQGQEAAVVVTSLTTSSAAEAPRGLDFLLSRNRLNVALSRAQVAAVLVMSPALLDSSPRSVAELHLLAGLARLRAMACTDLFAVPAHRPGEPTAAAAGDGARDGGPGAGVPEPVTEGARVAGGPRTQMHLPFS
ncbi:RecB family nuclease, putative, TM0106 family [Frankia torreyi]|uniref:RecB family nuclease, putative, TM0106 family n=3 Tax=Frankia TaxID=1854 RepID=A0A0D8BIG0_9ACTN|nr:MULTISPECIES: TM0106 family RecB-like putative nuclease [Frankia]KJE23916.1 RecB family nuclease, putative, TM0106 family [Frankia torreyi]